MFYDVILLYLVCPIILRVQIKVMMMSNEGFHNGVTRSCSSSCYLLLGLVIVEAVFIL